MIEKGLAQNEKGEHNDPNKVVGHSRAHVQRDGQGDSTVRGGCLVSNQAGRPQL